MASGFPLEGIVIKRSDVGEADRIIVLYTASHGKISLLAKGVRKPSSKRAASLELFNHIKCYVTHSKTPLFNLTEVKLLNTFSSWRGQLGRVAIAYQCVEAIDKLTPEQLPHPEVYELLVGFLNQISSLGADWRDKTMHHMKQLLELLGHLDPEHAPKDVYQAAEASAGRPLYAGRFLTRLGK